jgi:hypothetical protein
MKKTGFLAMAVLLAFVGVGSAAAAKKDRPPLTPTERCAKAILSAKERVLHRQGVLLARCVRAIAEGAPARKRLFRCSRMRRERVGADRVERNARDRLVSRCQPQTMPAWLPANCPGRGPELGRTLASPTDVAACMIAGGRCLARESVEQSIAGALDLLAQIEPAVLDFELGGVVGQTLAACGLPFATTTTLPVSTTTTTLATEPTTTTTTLGEGPTTTLPPEPTTTTTLPSEPTTTLPPETTTTTTTTSTTLPEPQAPSIVVTEIMSNPDAQSDSAGEYFEVLNTGPAPVDMQGWTVRDDGSNAFTITESLVVNAGEYALLARSETAGAGNVDYVYGSAMSLANSADQIIIERDGELVDRVDYDASFPLAVGASMELSPAMSDAVQNDVASNWCEAQTVMADGDRGSPGVVGSGCSSLQ